MVFLALECLQCLYANVTLQDYPEHLQLEIKTITAHFTTECAEATRPSDDSKISMLTCTGDPGYRRMHSCGTLKGTVDLNVLNMRKPAIILL